MVLKRKSPESYQNIEGSGSTRTRGQQNKECLPIGKHFLVSLHWRTLWPAMHTHDVYINRYYLLSINHYVAVAVRADCGDWVFAKTLHHWHHPWCRTRHRTEMSHSLWRFCKSMKKPSCLDPSLYLQQHCPVAGTLRRLVEELQTWVTCWLLNLLSECCQ